MKLVCCQDEDYVNIGIVYNFGRVGRFVRYSKFGCDVVGRLLGDIANRSYSVPAIVKLLTSDVVVVAILTDVSVMPELGDGSLGRLIQRQRCQRVGQEVSGRTCFRFDLGPQRLPSVIVRF